MKLMNLLASSNAFVHINKIGSSSPFKAYITIDKNKPAKTLNKEKTLTKECRYSMPSTLGQKCYMSATFSAAKASASAKIYLLLIIFIIVNFKIMIISSRYLRKAFLCTSSSRFETVQFYSEFFSFSCGYYHLFRFLPDFSLFPPPFDNTRLSPVLF